ncbi:MAG: hypothetical protein Q8922_08215, partial [Bacteroidota bacterium]|nr:hypothetical protein [Bacteroidota bacterium]
AHSISGAKSQRQFKPPIIAAFLWSCSISLFHQTMNGLETSLYSLCLLGVLWWYIERPHYPVILGVLLGLATLARIDAALLAAIIVAFDFWHRRYQSGAVIGLMAFLISSPWWIYNVLYFGSMMPTSGQAGQVWPSQIQDSISRLIQTLENIALVLGYLPDGLTLTERILAGLAIGAGILLVVWKTRVRQRLQESISVHKFLPFALFCGVLAIYYTFFFHFPHFITRYLQPLRILWLVLVAISLPAILDAYAEATSIRRHVVGTLAAIFLLGSLAFCVNRYWAVYDKSRQMEFYDMGQWAANHPTDKIGMLQSGLASFISPNVINLDGKVNAEALTTHIAGRLPRYIRNEKILYIADWKPFIEDVSDMCRRDELFFDSIGMVGRIQIMKRRDGITNEEVRITN